MALRSQMAKLVFTGGLEVNDGIVETPPTLSVLKNMVFDLGPTLRSGYGISLVSPTQNNQDGSVTSLPATGNGLRLATHKSTLLIELFSGLFQTNQSTGLSQKLRGARPAPGATSVFTDSAGFVRASLRTNPVGAIVPPHTTVLGQGDCAHDCCYSAGGTTACTLWAWEEYDGVSANHVTRLQLIREVDNVVLAERTLANAYSPRCVTNGAGLFWLYVTSATFQIQVLKIDFTGTSPSVPYTTTNYAVASDALFDACYNAGSGTPAIAYRNAALTLRVAILNSAGSADASGSTNAIAAVPVHIAIISTPAPTTGYNITALYSVAGGIVRSMQIGTNPLGETTTYTSVFAACARIAPFKLASDSTNFYFFVDCHAVGYTAPPQDLSGTYIDQVRVSRTTLVGTAITKHVMYGMIGGTPVEVGSVIAEVHVPVIYLSNESRDITPVFVVQRILSQNLTSSPIASQFPPIVARIAYGEAGNISNCWSRGWRVPQGFTKEGTRSSFPFLRWSSAIQSTFAGVSLTQNNQLWRALVDTTDTQLTHAEVNGITVLAGACPAIVDGEIFTEAGYTTKPEVQGNVTVAAGGLLTNPGTYSMVATYAWYDAAGNLHESAPSFPVSFATSAANQKFSYVVSSPLTFRGGASPGTLYVRTYRTIAGPGSVYYFDSQSAVYPGTTTISNCGLVADANIIAGTRAPTDGGVLPNDPMPPCQFVTLFDKRLWCGGAEQGDTIWFSQTLSDNFAPEWSALFKRKIPQHWGRLLNAVEMDGKLILFCEFRIGYIYGSGPSRTGAGDNYSQPIEAISTHGVRVRRTRSVAVTKDGIWFQSNRGGLRLLTRQLTIGQRQEGGEMGSELDDNLVSPGTVVSVTSAVTNESQGCVKFYCDNSTTYQYDFKWGQWSQFDYLTQVPVSAVETAGTYDTHLRADGTFGVLSESTYSGEGGTPNYVVQTQWLSFNGIQGFQRVRELVLLGRGAFALDELIMTVDAAYDYDGSTSQNIYTGSISIPAGDGEKTPWQLRIQLPRQKCEAVRFKITMSTPGSSVVAITAMLVELGLKKGLFKGNSVVRG